MSAVEVLREVLPYIGIVSLAITAIGLVYHYGKSQQKNDSDKEEIKKKLDELCVKVDKIPEELLAKSIDVYKMWKQIKEDPEPNKKRKTNK